MQSIINSTYVESELHLSRSFIDLKHGHIDKFKLVLDVTIVIFRFQVFIRLLVWSVILDLFELLKFIDECDKILILRQLLKRLCMHEQILAEITVRML